MVAVEVYRRSPEQSGRFWRNTLIHSSLNLLLLLPCTDHIANTAYLPSSGFGNEKALRNSFHALPNPIRDCSELPCSFFVQDQTNFLLLGRARRWCSFRTSELLLSFFAINITHGVRPLGALDMVLECLDHVCLEKLGLVKVRRG